MVVLERCQKLCLSTCRMQTTNTYQKKVLREGQVVAQQAQALAQDVVVPTHQQLVQVLLHLPDGRANMRRQLQETSTTAQNLSVQDPKSYKTATKLPVCTARCPW
jgi:hypothetical protein